MKELVEAMKKAKAEGYNAFGIRVIENEAGVLNVGDACPDSYDWDYELDCSTRDTTGEKLGGACAIEINTSMLLLDGDDDEDVAAEIEKAIKNSACYYGEQVEKKILSGEDRTAEEQKFHESLVILSKLCAAMSALAHSQLPPTAWMNGAAMNSPMFWQRLTADGGPQACNPHL